MAGMIANLGLPVGLAVLAAGLILVSLGAAAREN